ncbi:MAG TPA: hypothetical protein VNH83_22675 [Bryobacteraceae bacterium]|nr:hypothetical protein [Bryobacteraceae bacterium]
MNPLNGLAEYLQRIERRLRMLAVSRGVALAAGAALAFTVLGAMLANSFAFSAGSVFSARLVLFLALAGALGAGLIVPLLRLNRRKAAREAEQHCPRFEQRLVTFAERSERPDPFLELLAADTLEVARDAKPETIAPRKHILSFASAGAVAVAVLLWLGISGPGFLGYGTSLLWGADPHNDRPFYEVQVQPGDHTIRRKSDQIVTARLLGFQTGRVRVFAKFQSSSKWEEAMMRPQPGSPTFEFLFAGVPEAFDYYVEAAGVRSRQFHMGVADLPEVKKLRVTYHYPAWTGLKETVEDPGGDLRAVEGTEAEVRVDTDRPLAAGALLLDDGSRFDLRDGVARVPMQKDGVYHIATPERGDMVRLSNDYFIEVQKATPPSVRIVRPGRDAKVNPIEEVTVTVEAQDDFALRGMDLHYSVNGAPEKTVALGGAKGKSAEGSATLYLEDYKLVPGDIISMYASARDALSTSRSDIFFVEAQPFERQYTQSQQMGGAGGGEQPPRVAEHQKEIIAATWNQLKNPQKNAAEEQENARLLSGIQSKLRDQAKSLAERMRSRELNSTNPAFKQFADDMSQAVDAMGQAVEKLGERQWQAALPPEQKSLQHLLRAEAIFRDIQVAFGNSGGGAGGAGRDLEGLFDLELDREKNQFETGRNSASPDQRQKEIEEALAKLEELARRQQDLAEQQRQQQQAYQQRWQQEMLRREAEELRKKMEQLARSQQSASQNRQGQQQGQDSQQSQSQQSQGQSQGQQGQQQGQGRGSGGQNSALNRAIERLAEATRDMQNAGSPQNQGSAQSEAEARRAAERLREARQSLAGERKQQAGQQMEELARKSQELAEQQRNFENRMRQTFAGAGEDQSRPTLMQPGISHKQVEQLEAEQKKLIEALTQLEQEMQRAARDMAGSQRSASGKLRDALGDVQKQELRLKMGWTVEVMRRGMGAYALTRQPEITRGLNQLRDRMREAQSAIGREPDSGQALEAALDRVEQLRQRLEELKSAGQQPGAKGEQGSQRQKGEAQGQQGQQGQKDEAQGQQGSQSGKGEAQGEQGDGQKGQGRQGSPGRQPGRSAQASNGAPHSGEPGGGSSPEAASGRGGQFDSHGPFIREFDPATAGHTIREGIRDLGQLEQMLRSNREIPHDVTRDVQDLIREMRQVDSGRLSGITPERLDQIVGSLVDGTEQIELELRRLAGEKETGSVRSGVTQPAPPGYADAVAEYFRRLARQK